MPVKGRGVVANRIIKIGDTILIESPAVLAKITPFDESDETDFEAYAARQSWSLAKMLATHGSNKSIEDELMPQTSDHPIFKARAEVLQTGAAWILKSSNGKVHRSSDELRALIAKVMLNSFHMPKIASQGLFTRASMFNHSNDPAMVHYFENDTIVIKAIRDVDPGQELCISYVELLASQHDIRNQLISKYFSTLEMPSSRMRTLAPMMRCALNTNWIV